MRLIVVEDDPSLADIIRRNLEAHGHPTTVAGTADAASGLLVESQPDALIVDVNLPDFSGWEVLRRIDAATLARLPVIVISAAPISGKRLAEFQPARALQKPFSMTTLLHAIEDALREKTNGSEVRTRE